MHRWRTLLTLGLSPDAKDALASSWGSADAADAGRRQNEKAAFSKMVDDFVASWPKFLNRYARQG